jgi:hypothetical protein
MCCCRAWFYVKWGQCWPLPGYRQDFSTYRHLGINEKAGFHGSNNQKKSAPVNFISYRSVFGGAVVESSIIR